MKLLGRWNWYLPDAMGKAMRLAPERDALGAARFRSVAGRPRLGASEESASFLPYFDVPVPGA